MDLERRIAHGSPEGEVARQQERKFASIPLRELSKKFENDAKKLLQDTAVGGKVRDGVARFNEQISNARDGELENILDDLGGTLGKIKPEIRQLDETDHVRRAFLFALVGSYDRSLH